MTPRCLLLSVLAILSFCSVLSNPTCNGCCRFVETFPTRLKRLRQDYSQIQGLYEDNDLDTSLLDQNVEESFKTPFACHAINSVLRFYLKTVLPSALAGVTEETSHLREHMESIQQIFTELNSKVTECKDYFSCKKHVDITTLNSTYTEMESKGKGLSKAMGELQLLFLYIETYLASKRPTHG